MPFDRLVAKTLAASLKFSLLSSADDENNFECNITFEIVPKIDVY